MLVGYGYCNYIQMEIVIHSDKDILKNIFIFVFAYNRRNVN